MFQRLFVTKIWYVTCIRRRSSARRHLWITVDHDTYRKEMNLEEGLGGCPWDARRDSCGRHAIRHIALWLRSPQTGRSSCCLSMYEGKVEDERLVLALRMILSLYRNTAALAVPNPNTRRSIRVIAKEGKSQHSYPTAVTCAA